MYLHFEENVRNIEATQCNVKTIRVKVQILAHA